MRGILLFALLVLPMVAGLSHAEGTQPEADNSDPVTEMGFEEEPLSSDFKNTGNELYDDVSQEEVSDNEGSPTGSLVKLVSAKDSVDSDESEDDTSDDEDKDAEPEEEASSRSDHSDEDEDASDAGEDEGHEDAAYDQDPAQKEAESKVEKDLQEMKSSQPDDEDESSRKSDEDESSRKPDDEDEFSEEIESAAWKAVKKMESDKGMTTVQKDSEARAVKAVYAAAKAKYQELQSVKAAKTAVEHALQEDAALAEANVQAAIAA